MNRLLSVLFVIGVLFAAPASRAADWNSAYGQGNPSDDWLISGCSIPLSVITSVQSNTQYYVTSAKASGAARLDQVWFKTDMLASTIRFYVSTNVWTCASNQPAGTNIIWLTETNSAMATNDILVFRDVSADSYQMLVVSGNATDYAGTVYTNSLGQVGFKVFNTPTNVIEAGDMIYKMALQQSFNPLGMGVITNQITGLITNMVFTATPSDHYGQWLSLGSKQGSFFSFRAPTLGLPALIAMTTSNAAGGVFQVVGDYYARPRR